MPRAPPPTFYALSAIALFIWYIIYTHNTPITTVPNITSLTSNTNTKTHPLLQTTPKNAPSQPDPLLLPPDSTALAPAIMPHLANATAKALLGRSAWHLLHTTMSRFPDTPTPDESSALRSYIHLFARLYPCGECATHFQEILRKYPPQTGSRGSAAAWACFVHNEVNVSLGKEVFDCKDIGEWYDCGCGSEEGEKDGVGKKEKGNEKEEVTGEMVEIEKEGLMNGG